MLISISVVNLDCEAKDMKLGKLTKYIESFIEKCTLDADERCQVILNELDGVKREKLLVDKMVLKLTAENRRLQVHFALIF
jgi:hypothetical protein